MIHLIIATALAQGVGQAAPEPVWRPMMSNQYGIAYVDPASVRRDGDTFELVSRAVFSTVQEGGLASGISRIYFDCAHRLVALRHFTSFDANGRVIEDRDASGPPSQPHPANPGTPYSTIMDEYCPR